MFFRAVFTLVSFLLIAGPAWAASDAEKCAAAKLKEAGKYGFCRLKAESKYAKKGDAIKYAEALAKCDAKYSEKWGKAETKAEGACPTTEDLGSIQTLVSDHTDAVVAALTPGTPTPVTQIISMACSNNVTADIFFLPYTLTVTPLEPVVGESTFDVEFTGSALFPASFLNAAIATIPGLTEVTLNAANATVIARSGATGFPVLLEPDVPLPAQVAIPITNDEGLCTSASLPTPCVLEDLEIPLNSVTGTFVAGPSGGSVLFGWEELATSGPITLPFVIVTNPPGPNGIRALAVVLNFGMECYGGKDANPDPGIDDPVALDDVDLIAIPID